jgi:transposase-like protein
MSRRYDPDHKALVLRIMQGFGHDLEKTARYTGVPTRTLNDWRQELRQKEAAAHRAAAEKRQADKAAATRPVPTGNAANRRP